MRRNLPVCPVKCATCPFREGSPYADLAPMLTEKALFESGRSAIHHRTGKPPALCRGARDMQLAMFFGLGFIEAPTDEAWARKLQSLKQAHR